MVGDLAGVLRCSRHVEGLYVALNVGSLGGCFGHDQSAVYIIWLNFRERGDDARFCNRRSRSDGVSALSDILHNKDLPVHSKYESLGVVTSCAARPASFTDPMKDDLGNLLLVTLR